MIVIRIMLDVAYLYLYFTTTVYSYKGQMTSEGRQITPEVPTF